MLSSACSLRSTQCAALIALATAAGISRFEPTAVADAHVDQAGGLVHVSTTSAVRTTYFQFVLAFAPWLRAFEQLSIKDTAATSNIAAVATHPTAAHTAETWPAATLLSSPAGVPKAPRFGASGLGLGPSVHRHSFPYAVGPPAGAPTSNPRANDTLVSCDSVACRMSDLRIADRLFVSGMVRLARLEFAGAKAARPFSRPSFVQCDQLGFTARLVRHAPLRVPTGISAPRSDLI